MSYVFMILMTASMYLGFKSGEIGATGLCVMFGSIFISATILFVSNEWMELAKTIVAEALVSEVKNG